MKITQEEQKKLEEYAKNKLKITFKDLNLLKTALTHKSYLNENSELNLKHNERLEFLGDAVLELIITEYLFETYPDRPEGELTSFRAATVRTESLAETGKKLLLGEYLYISKGEDLTGGRTKPYLLANTYEAILGSIYKDQGYDIAKKFVYTTLVNKIDKIVTFRLDIDDKSKLQEQAQKEIGITPKYQLVSEEGPDHDKKFMIQTMIGKWQFGIGEGRNKQEAEQKAAKKTLQDWNKLIKKYKITK